MRQLETRLIELKARLSSLEPARVLIIAMGARYVGTQQQRDTYFNVQGGRLKLREVEGEASKLIYYEREDISEPKKSDVLLHDAPEPKSLKAILEKALGTRVVIEKTREIYRHKGTQIHLDTVDGLGNFIEFEREMRDPLADRVVLDELMEVLGIEKGDLIGGSYSDLMLEKEGMAQA